MKTLSTLSLLVCVVLLAMSAAVWSAQEKTGDDIRQGFVVTAVVVADESKILTLTFKDIPLSDALQKIFADTGLSYTVDPSLSQLKVTAVLKDVTFKKALNTVAQAVGAEFKVVGTAYSFTPKPASAYSFSSGGKVIGVAATPDEIVEVMVLRNLTLKDITPVLSRDGVENVQTLGDGRFLVKGNRNAVKAAIQQAIEIDTLSAPTKKIVRVEITINDLTDIKDGDKVPMSLLRIDVIEGQTAQVSTFTPDSRNKNNEMLPINATATPTITDDGRILLQVKIVCEGANNGQGILSAQQIIDPVAGMGGMISVQDIPKTRKIHCGITAEILDTTIRESPNSDMILFPAVPGKPVSPGLGSRGGGGGGTPAPAPRPAAK